ncbi:hypothetical protein [Hymenobacter metallilatus]|uniref:Uncharacterized protein n=1 Tax=Hymenobacter metallilatus TaxID=2493666 RepID=A0A3R9LPE1_9BACT|nr:hypothetical protein [Hymenobacter metallilatus]RSK24196.1 hypothetical protein EI290_20665 [Hymenobacter metallilatus]
MKLNKNRAKQSAIDTGAAVVGAVVAHAGSTYLSGMADSNATLGKVKQHIPAIVLGAVLAVQALDLVPASNDMVTSALLGAGVVSGMAAVREYTGANDETKNTAGVAEMVNKYVPGLSSGLQGLGYVDYTEAPSISSSLLAAGNTHRALNGGSMGFLPVQAAASGQDVRKAFAG